MEYTVKRRYNKGKRVYRENAKRRNKSFVAQLKLKAGHCHDCGLPITADILYLFDFDHREPRLKKFTLSEVRTSSLQAIVDEAEKCDVVCKNCHAHRTHRQRKDEHVQIIREARRRQRTTLLTQRRLFDEAS